MNGKPSRAFFVGQSGVRYAKKISVTADKIVCRVSNVDITARSCELTFKGAKQTITGRRASEIFATEAMAGVPPDGAAGSVSESLSKLNCTLDPAEIRKKAGGGVDVLVRDRQLKPPEAGALHGVYLGRLAQCAIRRFGYCHFTQLEKVCCTATRRGLTCFGPSRGEIISAGELAIPKSALGGR